MNRYNIQDKICYHLNLLKGFYKLIDNDDISLECSLNNIIAACDNIKDIARTALEICNNKKEETKDNK